MAHPSSISINQSSVGCRSLIVRGIIVINNMLSQSRAVIFHCCPVGVEDV